MNDILSFKIIIIGDSGVGKTSLLQRFIFDKFYERTKSTLGLDYANKEIKLKNDKMILLKLFDTAGQEKFRSLSKSYFRNADGVLFVYSVNDIKSFENIRDWIQKFISDHNGKKDIPLYLIENKNDLNREVEDYLINEFLNEYKFRFKSVSAKVNEDNSINELFQEISELLFKKYTDSNIRQKKIYLNDNDNNKNQGCNCAKQDI